MIANRVLELAKEAGFYVYDGKIFPVNTSEVMTERIEHLSVLIIKETVDALLEYAREVDE